jgi:hypothetical protein
LFALTAQREAASVLAFVDLARELHAHRAPPALVTRALRCAREEVGHARAFAALAHRAGQPIAPLQTSGFQVRSLEAIALDNAQEGLGTEFVGALRLRAQARSAAPALRPMFARIASEEAGHAGFSVELDRYLRSKLGSAARKRLTAVRREQMHQLKQNATHEPPCWQREELGMPSAELSFDLARRAEALADAALA